jgi:DNA-binding NarL/FixJ family response regulator
LRLAIRNANPHAIVIDQQLPGAIEVCADLTRGNPRRVVFVNVNQDDDSAMDALASGARGIVYSAAPIADIVKALHVVDNNQVWAPREVIVGNVDPHPDRTGEARRGRDRARGTAQCPRA